MPVPVTKVQIFVSSPSDVQREREVLERIVNRISRTIASEIGLVLELIAWETHMWPGFGEDAQDVINRQLGFYDIFIGIMWNRLGTPTGRAPSGTVEEFQRAYGSWRIHKRPSLMFYFNRKPYDFTSKEEVEQKSKVIEFQQQLQSLGALYWNYSGVEEFQELVFDHLIREIQKLKPTGPESETAISEQFCNREHWGNLYKLGDWTLDQEQRCIGSGIYQFLLSRNEYGLKSFTITAKITFYDYEIYKNDGMDTANAGIILGWKQEDAHHIYYNLLFTGDRILLEEIGGYGGDDYRDFRHIDSGTPMAIEEDREYHFVVHVTMDVIDVFVDGRRTYSVLRPRGLYGRVGLRPWRSRIVCTYFEVRDA